jgi:hypothetical protein
MLRALNYKRLARFLVLLVLAGSLVGQVSQAQVRGAGVAPFIIGTQIDPSNPRDRIEGDSRRIQQQLPAGLPSYWQYQPASSIGLLMVQFQNGEAFSCTAFLVGKRLILTAKHCLGSSPVLGSDIREMKFFALYGNALASTIAARPPNEPYDLHPENHSEAVARVAGVAALGASTGRAADDWALLRLNQNLGERFGWFLLSRRSAAEFASLRVFHAGYHGGVSDHFHRARVLGVEWGCRLERLYPTASEFSAAGDPQQSLFNPSRVGAWQHSCDSSHGASGSPIYEIVGDSNRNRRGSLLAISVAGSSIEVWSTHARNTLERLGWHRGALPTDYFANFAVPVSQLSPQALNAIARDQ